MYLLKSDKTNRNLWVNKKISSQMKTWTKFMSIQPKKTDKKVIKNGRNNG